MSSGIVRVQRVDPGYAQIPNLLIEDPCLSWKAKGLYSYLASRPPGWEVQRGDLLNRSTDGRTSVQSGINELKKAGWLTIQRLQDQETRAFVGVLYTILNAPDLVENPSDGKPVGWVAGSTENPSDINNTQSNNTQVNLNNTHANSARASLTKIDNETDGISAEPAVGKSVNPFEENADPDDLRDINGENDDWETRIAQTYTKVVGWNVAPKDWPLVSAHAAEIRASADQEQAFKALRAQMGILSTSLGHKPYSYFYKSRDGIADNVKLANEPSGKNRKPQGGNRGFNTVQQHRPSESIATDEARAYSEGFRKWERQYKIDNPGAEKLGHGELIAMFADTSEAQALSQPFKRKIDSEMRESHGEG
jgi:hypothetical protein